MSDQGFDFTPPRSRRERKKFKPPPWEKQQFDELSKQREQQEATVGEQDDDDTGAQEGASPDAAAELPATETKSSVGPRLTTAPVDESGLVAMLFELKAEDPSANRIFSRVGLVVGLLLLVLGIVLAIWASVMIGVASRLAQQGRTGVLIGLTVMTFGVGFAGTGAWFVFRSLRQQGVL